MANDQPPEPQYLVCALATQIRCAVPNTLIGQHECAECKRKLMVAPAGQRFIANHPGTKTICIGCMRLDDASSVEMAPGVLVEAMSNSINMLEDALCRMNNKAAKRQHD
jgi:hypothetical protein